MSAVEASSVSVKTMADGTLRITCDIEPRHAQDAFKLFGSPGTPMALAALRIGVVAEPEPEKPKGGTLAKSAGIICADGAFQIFAASQGYDRNEAGATALIYSACHIQSRIELDHDPKAAIRYGRLMEKYREFQKVFQ